LSIVPITTKGNEKIEEAAERYGYTQREVVSISWIMRERRGC